MEELFELKKFDSYKEDNRREVKKAEGRLPNSLWDTYSAFANCYGRVIILGVKEDKSGNWHTTGLKNAAKLKKDFWDTINNRKKVSINLLKDDDVETFSVAGADDVIMVIWVPSAKREQKPVYINDDLFGGTFRRNWEGDYHCTRLQVKTMLRDQAEETMDMEVIEEADIEDLNQDSIRGYRNSHKSFKPGHPFERLDDKEYLRVIGAAGFSKDDKRIHPTAAGMLMFGNEYDIVRYFPDYFLDYRENPDTVLRWQFIKKQAIKTSDKKQATKTSDKKQAIKTKNNQEKIRLFLRGRETAKTRDVADLLGLSMARTREILSVMDDVEAMGRNKARIYRLRKES